ncbi:CHAT domain-containing protein [Kitasatospora sp. NPDC050463]|uniref:CHAT domain-containing tetratricopeptide repeat protein n=1 Tax=Kitasatospora sp. NPDC050463 TaxID=3155786 RepID=UPI003408FBC6
MIVSQTRLSVTGGGADPAAQLLLHHLRTGDRPALDRAVRIARRYLRTAPPDEPGRSARAGNLLVALLVRWQLLGHRRDLDDLITLGVRCAAAEPPAAQDVRLLALAYRSRFDLDRRPADLDGAVAMFARAAGLPQPPPTVGEALAGLGGALSERFRVTGREEDLTRAESAYRRALDGPWADPTDRAALLLDLGNVLHDRHELRGDTEALGEALELWRAVSAVVPAGHEARLPALHNLAQGLRIWSTLTGDPTDRAEMLRVNREALAGTPAGQPGHGACLAGLGVALRLVAEETDDLGALRESVELLRRAVALREGDATLYAGRLNSLGNALHRLAQWTGDVELLDEAVEVLREALAGQPPGTKVFGEVLANLAVTLHERGFQTNDPQAVQEAAELARRAVDEGPVRAADRVDRLANLGVVLQSRHGETGEPALAAEAIAMAREALALTASGSPALGDRLNHLANALRARFDSTGERADLDEAVALLERAVEVSPYGDPRLPLTLSNLGNSRLDQYRTTGDDEALDRAVSDLGRAVWAGAEGTGAHGTYLQHYADALLFLHQRDGDPAVLRAAADAYRQSALTEAMPADGRIRAAWDWGVAAAEAGRWEEALRGYGLAVRLLPFVASGRLARGDQERSLSRVHGLAAEAAACAVQTGDLVLAVQLLEQGRGVLLGRTIATRDGLGRLRRDHPAAAERFRELSERIDALDAADPAGARSGLPAGGTDLRHTLAARFERLVTEIRALPGFADFLAPPSPAVLAEASERGPVVLAYCSGYRSDALVLWSGQVLLVPLPAATPEAVDEQVRRLEEALVAAADPATDRVAQTVIGEVLGWTWDHVTGPVLDRLGLSGAAPGGPWPRVWWSPGGALSALPLHAAGHHDDAVPDVLPDAVPDGRRGPGATAGSPRTVLDRVISSYTPTVRALAYARARETAPEPGRSVVDGPSPDGRSPDGPWGADGLLAVAMPETPDARPLTGARREVELLRGLLPTEVLIGEEATLAGVLEALPRHAHVHFACHGVSEPEDPSTARLLVHDHRTAPLTVRRIARLDLPAARLAVLSACETARGAGELADEAIHITSAFQLAGYAHAVGTLWPVHDLLALRMTRLLYQGLRAGRPAGAPGLDTDRTAEALHHAVRQCRTAFSTSPGLWAAHVHAGA